MTVLANCFHCGKAVLVRKETLAANKPSYCAFCRNVLGMDAPATPAVRKAGEREAVPTLPRPATTPRRRQAGGDRGPARSSGSLVLLLVVGVLFFCLAGAGGAVALFLLLDGNSASASPSAGSAPAKDDRGPIPVQGPAPGQGQNPRKDRGPRDDPDPAPGPDRPPHNDPEPGPGPEHRPPNDPNPGQGRNRAELPDWVVHCFVDGRWTESPTARMDIVVNGDTVELTNNTGIIDHAGIVTRRKLEGDYTVRIEVRGARSVGLKSANNDVAWAGIDNLDDGGWKAVVFTRRQGRVAATVNGRPVPLFDVNSAGGLGQAVFYVHIRSNATAAVRRFEIQ
jgi:hypothetical protein